MLRLTWVFRVLSLSVVLVFLEPERPLVCARSVLAVPCCVPCWVVSCL